MKLVSAGDLAIASGLSRMERDTKKIAARLAAAGVEPVTPPKGFKRGGRPTALYDSEAALAALGSETQEPADIEVRDVAEVRRLMRKATAAAPLADEWISYRDVMRMCGRSIQRSFKAVRPALERVGLMTYHKVEGEGKECRHFFPKSKVMGVIDSLRPTRGPRAKVDSRAAAVRRVASIVSHPRIEKMPETTQKCKTVEDYLKATLETVQSLQKELRSLQVQVAPMVKATPGMMQLLGNIQSAICANPLEPESGVVSAANQGISLDSLVSV